MEDDVITQQELEAQGCKCVMNVEAPELHFEDGRSWYWIVTTDGICLGCNWSPQEAWDTTLHFFGDGEDRRVLPDGEFWNLDGTPYVRPQAVTA